MTHTTRRLVVLGIAALLLLLFAGLAVTAVRTDFRRGWAGFAFQAAISADVPIVLPIQVASGRVVAVAAWSPAERAGIKVGDVVESIDGTPIADLPALRQRQTELRPGDTVEFRVRREDQTLTMSVVLSSSMHSPQILLGTVSSLVTGLVFLAISLLVGWVQPRSRAAWVFFLMSAAGAAVFLGWALVEPNVPDLSGLLPIGADLGLAAVFGVFLLFSVVLTNLLLHLVLVFPEERPVLRRWPEVLAWIHTLPLLPAAVLAVVILGGSLTRFAAAVAGYEVLALALLMVCIIRIVRRAGRGGLRSAALASPWSVQGAILAAFAAVAPAAGLVSSGTATAAGILSGFVSVMFLLLIMLVWSVVTCVELARGYRTAGADARHQLRWPVWGTLVAVGGSGIIVILLLVAGTAVSLHPPASTIVTLAVTSMSKLIYILIPLSFAFGILKYRLMAIDLIVRKTVVYTGLTGFVVAGYFLIVGVFGVILVAVAGVRSQSLTVIATVVVALLLVPARNRIQAFVDRRLFHRERAYDDARERLSAHVRTAEALGPLLAWMADEVQAALGSRTVAILVREPDGRRLRAATTVGLSDAARASVAVPAGGRLAASTGDVVRVDAATAHADDADAVTRTGARLAALARHRGEVLGMIVVGGELGRDPYDNEDERFLADAAAELGLALATLQSRRVELEFDEAREIQRSLLPRQLAQIDGVDVAAQLGTGARGFGRHLRCCAARRAPARPGDRRRRRQGDVSRPPDVEPSGCGQGRRDCGRSARGGLRKGTSGRPPEPDRRAFHHPLLRHPRPLSRDLHLLQCRTYTSAAAARGRVGHVARNGRPGDRAAAGRPALPRGGGRGRAGRHRGAVHRRRHRGDQPLRQPVRRGPGRCDAHRAQRRAHFPARPPPRGDCPHLRRR